nr:efflux RND transporter permease subunit [Rickettsia akari]
MQGLDQDELFNFTPKLEDKLVRMPSFIDVTSDLQIAQPQTLVQMLSLVNINSTNGNLVPLTTITKIVNIVDLLSISHFGQLPSVTVSFKLQDGYSISNAVPKVNQAIRDLQIPDTITGSFQGTAQAFQSSFSDLGYCLWTCRYSYLYYPACYIRVL